MRAMRRLARLHRLVEEEWTFRSKGPTSIRLKCFNFDGILGLGLGNLGFEVGDEFCLFLGNGEWVGRCI